MTAVSPVPAEPPLEIVQDREYHDGEFYDPLPVFWAKGHDHDPEGFVRAVVDYCLHEGVDLPAIPYGEWPVEVWQRNVEVCDGVEYRREPERPPGGANWFPITILDLVETRRRGGPKCAVIDCREPWAVGAPVRACTNATKDKDGPEPSLRFYLCRGHSRTFPEPSYRVFMVPVGATILLPIDERKDEGL